MTVTTKTLTIVCDQGTMTETVEVDNDASISVYRNGYSNWDGKRHIMGFRIKHADLDSVFDEQQKGAANEVAHRLVRKLLTDGKGRATNLTFTLRKS
jgi:hypothetical protein